MGEIFSHTRGRAVLRPLPRNFFGRGEGLQAFGLPWARPGAWTRRHPRPCPGADVASRQHDGLNSRVFLPLLGYLPGRLSVVAGLAQALQVGTVSEADPVPSVGLDVVHHCGLGTHTPSGTLPAPWLAHELIGPQIVRPDGQAVPAVPLGGYPASRPLGLVPRAPALTGEFRTPRVPAGPERSVWHGLSPPHGQTKKDQSQQSHPLGRSSALVLSTLALCDIHDIPALTLPAV